MSKTARKIFTALWICIGLLSGANVTAANNDFTISGPYTKNNLSFYLIHGEDRIKDQNYLTLGEALQQKKVRVYETSNVNQLSIQNLSKTDFIYIQAGDIVKGGKQDRVFSTDMVLEPGSGKIRIDSFCVEQGRWQKRGNESVAEFNSSTKKLVSKDLRLAARHKKDQSEVWREVAKTQDKLSEKVGREVKARESESSLQLALENNNLTARIVEYKKSLANLPESKQDVIGYAFAVNGKLNTADMYANHNLFLKLWPKILDSAATESLAEYDEKLQFNVPDKTVIARWMKDAEKGRKNTTQLKQGLHQDTRENAENVQFETYSGKGENKKLYRKNIIRK
ncbi:MAG: hypothetical protein OEY07_07355 [Gammaproteobacteria bacterium]|nr:hypothetical protein [Gammaproteobacteria bacterium]